MADPRKPDAGRKRDEPAKIPNASTRRAIRDARSGRNVRRYASTAELLARLGL